MYRIQVSNSPNQKFRTIIPVNESNIEFQFKLWYNMIAGYWLITIIDYKNSKELISNIPLLFSYEGYMNILFQFEYMNIGVCFVFPSDEELKNTSCPNDKNLGNGYEMIWGDNDGW